MTTTGSPSSSSPSSQRTTPTYSSDLSKLYSTHPDSQIAHSFSEARDTALQWDVLCPSSPLRHRVRLNTDEEWMDFLSDFNKSEQSGETIIDLAAVLKRCYDLAFSMPPSPSALARLSPLDLEGGAPEPLTI